MTKSKFEIYAEDCLIVLPRLAADSIDLVVMSPPYNVGRNYGEVSDERPWPDYYHMMKTVFRECLRIMRSGAVMAVNVPGVVRWQADHKYADTWSDYQPNQKTHRRGKPAIGRGRIEPLGFRLFDLAVSEGFLPREPIVWVKALNENYEPISTTNMAGSDNNPYLRAVHEWILLFSKNEWHHRGGTGRRGKDAVPDMTIMKDVWFMAGQTNYDHPATFPIELPRRLINLFVHAADAIVLDPFLGSGTTGVAAAEKGLGFIGIEKNPEYARRSTYRIEAVYNQIKIQFDLGKVHHDHTDEFGNDASARHLSSVASNATRMGEDCQAR